MKAITIWQPWASLLACGAKQYETRSWATNYRGPIAIHAATRPVDPSIISRAAHYPMAQALMQYARQFAPAPGYNIFGVLPRGCVVAIAELVGCNEIGLNPLSQTPFIAGDEGVVNVTGNEYLFGDWTPGRYAWEFANMKILDEPIPAKGRQGLWNWEGNHEL